MNRWIAAFAALAAFLVLFASGASAWDYKKQYKKIGVGVRAGYSSFDGEQSVDVNTGSIIDFSYDSAFTYGADATVFFLDFLSVVLSVDYLKTDIDIKGESEKYQAEIKQIPLLATVRFHPVRFGGFMPYAGAGVGYYYNKWSSNSDVFKKLDVDSNAGVHACLGLEWLVTEHHAVSGEVRYAWDSYQLSDKAGEKSTGTDENINADAFTVSLGYRYYFW